MAKANTKDSKKYHLCIMERTLIARQDQDKALNKRREVMSKCRHKDKHLLTNWVSMQQPQSANNSLLPPAAPLDHQEHPRCTGTTAPPSTWWSISTVEKSTPQTSPTRSCWPPRSRKNPTSQWGLGLCEKMKFSKIYSPQVILGAWNKNKPLLYKN